MSNTPLFIPKTKNSKMIFRISDRCGTNCLYCKKSESSTDTAIYRKSTDILSDMKKMMGIISPDFSFMLYGGSSLDFDGLENVLSFLEEKGIENIILHENLDFSEQKIAKLRSLSEKYDFCIEICRTIHVYDEVMRLIRIINLFMENGLKIHINIEMDPEKFSKIIDFLKQKYQFQRINSTTSMFVLGKNIQFSLIEKKFFHINHEKGIVENISYSECFTGKSYSFTDSKTILVEDELELDESGSLQFHSNVLCYMSGIRISHISKTISEIYTDFVQFKEIFVRQKNTKPIQKSCYECYMDNLRNG